ncbi:unnamed protein product [Danaus chrysippus]|uniref:(African queen) hypothetical protein n=1 Tax=Danaus chrysippus TaxID=151541 RepID=A0A8J2R3U5_9NEOP|nr:unnamed protein product [Danaus chrysippus]
MQKVYANSPCPLFARSRRVTIMKHEEPTIVRICQAPIDDTTDTPYLKYKELAKKLGAWDAVRARCAFCGCCKCCGCGTRCYTLGEHHDDDRRREMKDFDARVKNNYQEMRIMYDKI